MGKEIRLYQLIFFTKFSAPTHPNRPFRQGYVRMFHVKIVSEPKMITHINDPLIKHFFAILLSLCAKRSDDSDRLLIIFALPRCLIFEREIIVGEKTDLLYYRLCRDCSDRQI